MMSNRSTSAFYILKTKVANMITSAFSLSSRPQWILSIPPDAIKDSMGCHVKSLIHFSMHPVSDSSGPFWEESTLMKASRVAAMEVVVGDTCILQARATVAVMTLLNFTTLAVSTIISSWIRMPTERPCEQEDPKNWGSVDPHHMCCLQEGSSVGHQEVHNEVPCHCNITNCQEN